jgi:hypothetical protein
MRAFVAVTSLFALSCLPAKGEVACREYWRAPHAVEWVEQGAQRGARIVARDPSWKLLGLGRYATSHAACETCANDRIGAAVLWLGAGNTSNVDLERTLAPEIVARIMAPFPFQVSDAYVHAEAESVAVSIGGLEARARAVDIDYRDGRSHHVIAVSAVKGRCVVVYGILHAWNGAEVALERIEAFASAIEVESYAPKPDDMILNPPPDLRGLDFPLGDAFRQHDMDDHRSDHMNDP